MTRWMARFCVLVGIAIAAPAAWAEGKLALVVGIDEYKNLPATEQLQRAGRDAESVGDTLAKLGFKVTRLIRNVDGDSFVRQLDTFVGSIERGDTVVLFYAGHGISLDDGNYLIPSDIAAFASGEESIVKRHSIAERHLVDKIRGSGAKIALMVFDACRDNPFPRKHGRGIGPATRGLALVQPAEGMFTIYSAGAGQTALDRLSGNDPSPNSVFTRVFLTALNTPGLSLSEMGGVVRDEVVALAKSDGHDQVPAVYDELIGSRLVYLAGREPVSTAPKPPAATSPPPPPAVDGALAAWAYLKNSTDRKTLAEFLSGLPEASPLRRDVEARLAALPDTAAPPLPGPSPAPPVEEHAKTTPTTPPQPSREAKLEVESSPSAPLTEPSPWTASRADVANWKLKKATYLGGYLQGGAVTKDRALFVTGGFSDGIVRVLDPKTLKTISKFGLKGDRDDHLDSLSILADDKTIVVARSDTIELHRLDGTRLADRDREWLQVRSSVCGGSRIRTVFEGSRPFLYCPNGQTNLTLAMNVFVIEGDRLVHHGDYTFAEAVTIKDVSRDGRYFLVVSQSNAISIFDTKTRQIIWKDSETCIDCLAHFGIDQDLIAYISGDIGDRKTIGIVNRLSGARSKYQFEDAEAKYFSDFSPDGNYIAVSSTNLGQILILPASADATSLAPLVTLRDRSKQNVSAAFFVANDAFVSASADNNARLWRR